MCQERLWQKAFLCVPAPLESVTAARAALTQNFQVTACARSLLPARAAPSRSPGGLKDFAGLVLERSGVAGAWGRAIKLIRIQQLSDVPSEFTLQPDPSSFPSIPLLRTA